MLSFTKGNFNKIMMGKHDLSWRTLKASTPIEAIMEKGLLALELLVYRNFKHFQANIIIQLILL